MNRNKLITSLLLFILLVTSACTRQEIIFRFPVTSIISGFDPIMLQDNFSQNINRNIFEALVQHDGTEFTPLLGVYWHPISDSLFAVKISDNIRFSDGELMTANDVLASMNRSFNNPRSFLNTEMILIDSFSVCDKNYLYIHNQNEQLLVHFLSRVPIFKASDINNFDDDFLLNNPTGTGKYYLYSNDENKVVFRKNRFHRNYRQNRNSPDIVEVIYVDIQKCQYEMFVNKEVDFVIHVSQSFHDEIFTNPKITAIKTPSNTFYSMVLDARRDVTPGINLPQNPLKDKNVRFAIAHAIDVQGFINNQLFGLGNIIVIPALPRQMGYPDHLDYYKFDINLSKALMEESGFGDGFDLKIVSLEGGMDRILCNFIQQSLASININVSVEFYSSAEFMSRIRVNPPTAYMLRTGAAPQATTITSMLVHFFLAADDGTPTTAFNTIPNFHMGIISSLSNLRSAEPYRTLDPRWSDYAYQTANMVYDELLVLPFFQRFDVWIHCNSFSFNYREQFLFSDFRKVRR